MRTGGLGWGGRVGGGGGGGAPPPPRYAKRQGTHSMQAARHELAYTTQPAVHTGKAGAKVVLKTKGISNGPCAVET
jgi:hypothetical protein